MKAKWNAYQCTVQESWFGNSTQKYCTHILMSGWWRITQAPLLQLDNNFDIQKDSWALTRCVNSVYIFPMKLLTSSFSVLFISSFYEHFWTFSSFNLSCICCNFYLMRCLLAVIFYLMRCLLFSKRFPYISDDIIIIIIIKYFGKSDAEESPIQVTVSNHEN